jgi:RHS repeat-associated protein
VRSSSGASVTTDTFKKDVTANGFINSGDFSVTGTAVYQGAALFPDFAFTGHYYHARSGLYLAPYRAYNPSIGRWLSRDPIAEVGGINLYAYVENNSVNLIDPSGLLDIVYARNTSRHTQALVARALAVLRQYSTGQMLLSLPGTVTISDATGGLGPYWDPETGQIGLDPNDPLGIGLNAPIRAFPDELPRANESCEESTDKALAVILGHELGHAVLGLEDEPIGNNVNFIENPLRIELGLPIRLRYHGTPIRISR